MNTTLNTNNLSVVKSPPYSVDSVGKPCAKPTIAKLDLAAVLISLLCLSISICTISPSLQWSWRLGFQGQIIVIGFMISIMNQCLMRFLPTSLTLIETRWGESRLQNYDAILCNSAVANDTGPLLRVVLLFFLVLPMTLSIAYKKLLGGESTINIQTGMSGNMYGLFPPTNTSSVFSENFANPLYIYINSTSSFFEQSVSDDSFPYDAIAKNKTIPYGHNLLLLSNHSAAALDLPRLSYLQAIKKKLWMSESWTISAAVYGLVVQMNETIEDMRTVDNFWDGLSAAGTSDLYSVSIFRSGISLGSMPFLPSLSQPTSASSLFGFYSPSRGYSIASFSDSQDPEVLAFRHNASLFTVHRQLCNATWKVTVDSIQLLRGDCPVNADKIESAMFSLNGTAHPRINANQSRPFELDSLPITVHSLNTFADGPANSPWKTPSTMIAVAGIYWARVAFLIGKTDVDGVNATTISSDFLYTAKHESIRSTKSTLHAHTPMSVVLALQPAFTVFMCFLSMFLYVTPVSNNFNLVSILSGVDPETLPLIDGAGLSGKLKRPVMLKILIVEKHIRYELSEPEECKDKQKRSL
jgi:hypothetical protein